MLLGGMPSATSTNLLYAGEMYDSSTDSYYLRARYYSSSTGTFNRTDPFEGSNSDPQSLHKYLYCHANPVNGVDPTGNSLILEFTISTAIRGLIAATLFGTISTISAKVQGATWGQALWAGLKTAGITGFAFISPLFAWCLLAIAPILITLGIYAGDITTGDIPELAAYVAAGIALMLLFKSPQFKTWEVKAALKVNSVRAIRNLKTGHSVRPGRNWKWERAVKTGNQSVKGTLYHAELADLMQKEGMTNLGVEVSFDKAGNEVPYGTKGSIRLDYVINHKGQVIKIIDVKPTDVINGTRMNQISQYMQLSADDIEAFSYGGNL